MRRAQLLVRLLETEVQKMSQIFRYHQHWRATQKERHFCAECGELAIHASWREVDGFVAEVNWYCTTDHDPKDGKED